MELEAAYMLADDIAEEIYDSYNIGEYIRFTDQVVSYAQGSGFQVQITTAWDTEDIILCEVASLDEWHEKKDRVLNQLRGELETSY